MNVLSLFDGISCGQVALERAGIKVDNYFASEVDKHAIKVTMKNYPNTIQLGDVRNVKGSDFPKIDLLMGGSPCQGFSFAGKQLNFDDPRSKLFFEYVRIGHEVVPDYWLLENVRMKKESQDVISGLLGYDPIMINSSLVSAQNRVRLYWTNIPDVGQPEDKGLLLRDIIESGELLGRQYENGTPKKNHYKACTLTGGAHSGGNHSDMDILVFRDKSKTVRVGGRMSPIGNKQEWDSPFNSGINIDNLSYRRLTCLECERLQTLPDGYTEGISNSQRYKALGNGWTVDVIAHILKNYKSLELL
jgi:DNA-cytosine methyltransferase